jgi:Family of unknown function (DUF5988)
MTLNSERKCLTDRILVFLKGGPVELPLQSRSFHVSRDLEIIRISHRGGRECYKATDRWVYFAGNRCCVFEWAFRDEID